MTNVVSPVGTIIAYAGAWTSAMEGAGWLLCDGRNLSTVVNQELFSAIGVAFGGNAANAEFNIPDLRGQFLRGVSGTATTDPDASKRTALQTGGNTGNKVGSLQAYGTAPPTAAFTSYYATSGSTASDKEKGNTSATWPSGNNSASVTGGDLETRAVNKYVYFLIKYATYTSDQTFVVMPVGAVVPFGGVVSSVLSGNYLLCDGTAISSSQYAALTTAIGFAHGKDSNGNAVLPDYRGYFLREVTGAVTTDPDSASRTAPYSGQGAQSPGNAGNLIGSVQQYATAIGSTLTASIPQQVTSDDQKRGQALSQTIIKWNGNNSTLKFGGGGDKESRPLNMAVDWFIKYQ